MYINHLSADQKRMLGGLPRPIEQQGATAGRRRAARLRVAGVVAP
jgi:hypothetical protein